MRSKEPAQRGRGHKKGPRGSAIVGTEALLSASASLLEALGGCGPGRGLRLAQPREVEDAITQEGDGSSVPFAPCLRWPGWTECRSGHEDVNVNDSPSPDSVRL